MLLGFLKNNKTVLVSEILLFALSAFLALAAGLKVIAFRQVGTLPPPQPLNPAEVILALLFATFLILLVPFWLKRRSGLKHLFFKGVFLVAAYFGGILLLALWLPGFLALSLMLFLLIWWFLRPQVWLHDLILILAITGLASFWGVALSPLAVIIFLAAMSIYDFIAVYKTRHMVFMAKEMIEAGSPLAFILPQKPAGFLAQANNIKIGEEFIFLGGGDIALPLLLTTSLIPQGLEPALVVGFFGLLGILASLFLSLSQPKRRPIPALPPIALACLVGYLLTRLI